MNHMQGCPMSQSKKQFKVWFDEQDFWKTDNSEIWPIWDKLHNAGLSLDDVESSINSVVSIMRNEYGD